MKQVVRKKIAETYGITNEEPIYTLLVDGTNLLKIGTVCHKINSYNEDYGIVFQFMLQLRKMLEKKDFNFVYVFFDCEGSGVLRYQYYKDYKVHRDKHYDIVDVNKSEYDKFMDEYVKKVLAYSKKKERTKKDNKNDDEERINKQKPIISACLEELFIRQMCVENVEGDDLIAYYVQHKKPNEKIVIYSGDRDLTQLIADDVCLYVPQLKKFIHTGNHIEEIGYTHENVLLKKILCGDVSDSIKGIKGLGETTLFKLFPEMKTQKMELNEVISKAKTLNEERVANKKKPLSVLTNIIERNTDGVQGKDIYEINDKIINLRNPLLTQEAIDELESLMHAPLDPTSRSPQNLIKIIRDNDIVDWISEQHFANFFSVFERIREIELKYFKKSIERT